MILIYVDRLYQGEPACGSWAGPQPGVPIGARGKRRDSPRMKVFDGSRPGKDESCGKKKEETGKEEMPRPWRSRRCQGSGQNPLTANQLRQPGGDVDAGLK